jgi:hypothetical protein
MQQAALAAARPHATLDIAKDLADIAFAEKAKQKQQQGVAAISKHSL